MTKQKKATIITIICSAIILAVIIAMVCIVLVKNKSNKINLTNNNKYYIVIENPINIRKKNEQYDGIRITITDREENKAWTATKLKYVEVKHVEMQAVDIRGELNGIDCQIYFQKYKCELVFVYYPNNPKNNVLLINYYNWQKNNN
jgi:hypothetical protein